MIVGNMPLVIMGMPVPVAVVLGFLISVTLIVQHSNVDARLGPLASHLVHWTRASSASRQLGNRRRLQLRPTADGLGQAARHLQREAAAADYVERPGRRRATEFPEELVEQLILPFVYKPGEGEPERYQEVGCRQDTAQEARDQVLHAAE